MYKYVLAIFALVLMAGTSCDQQVDIEKEKEAILALITEETQAYHDKDYERFAACYVQDESNIRILGGENEKMSYTVGFEEVGSSFKEWFENNPEPTPNREVKKNFTIKVYNDCAWIVFEEEDFVVDIKEYWHFDYGNASWALEKKKKQAIYGKIKE